MTNKNQTMLAIEQEFTNEGIEQLITLEKALKKLTDIVKERKELLTSQANNALENGEKYITAEDIVISKTKPTLMQQSDYMKKVEDCEDKLAEAKRNLQNFTETGECGFTSKPIVKIAPKPKSDREMIINNEANKLVKSLTEGDARLSLLLIEKPKQSNDD